MKKLLKAGVLFSGLLILGSFVGFSYANADKCKGDHCGLNVDKKVEHMTKQLGLTSEQQTSLRSILNGQKDQMDKIHEQMKALHDETHSKIEAILTSDQKAKFQNMKAERKEHMMGKKK